MMMAMSLPSSQRLQQAGARLGVHAGVDIGGTKIAVCLAPASSTVDAPSLLTRLSLPTEKTGAPDAIARQVLHMLDITCQQQGLTSGELKAVGVAACGPFVRRAGMIELANPNICGGLAVASHRLGNDWTHAPLEAPLTNALGKDRVQLGNDAAAALQAERRWGALRGTQDCAYVTWSTGIGVGLCVDGRILRGKNGNAGHAGHSFVADVAGGTPTCGCGNQGDVESLIAGGGLAQRLGQTAPELLNAATAGETAALGKVRELCGLMGRLLFNLVTTLDLQRISLGGSVFLHHQGLLLPLLRSEFIRYFPVMTEGVELVPAGLGHKVGDYAALALLEE